jgi:hypothetical protein
VAGLALSTSAHSVLLDTGAQSKTPCASALIMPFRSPGLSRPKIAPCVQMDGSRMGICPAAGVFLVTPALTSIRNTCALLDPMHPLLQPPAPPVRLAAILEIRPLSAPPVLPIQRLWLVQRAMISVCVAMATTSWLLPGPVPFVQLDQRAAIILFSNAPLVRAPRQANPSVLIVRRGRTSLLSVGLCVARARLGPA